MPNCQAETSAVGGCDNGRAVDCPCSARAMATAMAAAWALNPLGETESGSGAVGFSSAGAFFSAVKVVSRIIITQSRMIAPKTSPMPRTVIWRERVKSVICYPFMSLRGRSCSLPEAISCNVGTVSSGRAPSSQRHITPEYSHACGRGRGRICRAALRARR